MPAFLALILSASASIAQTAPASPAPAAAAAEEKDEVVMLSPFEVVSDARGYFSTNSMSGTRFNTKLEDLASSMSIMTKGQMEDFAMLDINDIFLYTGNAEGTGTYTDFVVDRNGQTFDNVQLNPNNANRIRGITSANQSYGNFEVSGRMPIDPLLVESVEISRGPNANVFGLGLAGGTVNQVPSSANLSRQKTRAELRVDSYEGWRAALDHNVVLIKDKLAFRVSGAQQREAFQRKPSGMNSRRINAMIKFRPFKYTTISASAVDYRSYGNRPNFTPPRDNVSYWIRSGRPAWNPTTSTYTINGVNYGVTGGVVVAGGTGPITNDTLVPDFLMRPNYMFQRSNIYIDRGTVGYWTAPNSTSATTPFTSSGSLRLQLSGVGYGNAGNSSGGRAGSQPLIATLPAVSDKSLYDWSSVNLSAVNRLRDRTEMYLAVIDQVLLNTTRQNLTVQAAYLSENNDRYSRTPIGNSGNSGVSGQLFVDVNTTHLDGTPNPFFGRTFIGVSEPRTVYNPVNWKTYRGQFAYRLDLSQEKNALKWAGTHQLSGYYEDKERISRSYVYRDILTSDHPWVAARPANEARANQSGNGVTVDGVSIPATIVAGQGFLRNFTRYYVGDNSGYNVDFAPTEYRYGTYDYHYGPAGNFRTEAATIGELATTDGSGGFANTKVRLKTKGAVLQSTFLNNKVIVMTGLREDRLTSQNGAVPVNLVGNLRAHDFDQQNQWNPSSLKNTKGKTKTYSAVVRPFSDLPFVTRATASSGMEKHFGQLLRGLGFTYIHSDNFVPQSAAVDLQLRPLPNTTGEGREWGLWLNMLDDKLSIRFNRYDNKQLNARDTDANTYTQRLLRIEFDYPNTGDRYQLFDHATTWVTAQNPTWTTQQIRTRVAEIMQIPEGTYNALLSQSVAGNVAAPADVNAKGSEIEIHYNPSRYWTVTASAEEKTSKNANVSASIIEWINFRMPVWRSVLDPRGPDLVYGTPDDSNIPWFTTNYGGSQTAEQNFLGNVQAPFNVLKQQEGKSRPSIRRYSGRISSSFQLAAITDHSVLKNFRVGGAVRYESKGAIGYRGVADAAGVYQYLDINQPVYDKAHYYFDGFVSYRTKLFRNRIGASFQLNCRNIQEGGRLQPIGVMPDGSPHSWRIVDPRQFILSASFDL